MCPAQPGRGSGFLLVATAALAIVFAAGAPCVARSSHAAQFLAQSATPSAAFYGACGSEIPTSVTVQGSFSSPLSLDVTLRYRYLSADPRAPGSPTLQVAMPLVAADEYQVSIDIRDQASSYVNGARGTLQYQIEARSADGRLLQSEPAEVAIEPCSPAPPNTALRASGM